MTSDGEILAFVDEHGARELIRRGEVEILRTKKRVRMLRAIDAEKATRTARQYRGSGPRPTRYSHDRETDDNPHGCWTLVRIPRAQRPIFTRVLDDCLTEKAA